MQESEQAEFEMQGRFRAEITSIRRTCIHNGVADYHSAYHSADLERVSFFPRPNRDR